MNRIMDEINRQEILDKIQLGMPETDLSIIAASPIVKQPITVAYRIVIRWNGDTFGVHDERFDDWTPSNPGMSFLSKGDYYREYELHLAMACFARRVAEQADYVQSIYREAN